MAAAIKLKHADGTDVTAQEAYDAFMNTRVLIVIEKTHMKQSTWCGTTTIQRRLTPLMWAM